MRRIEIVGYSSQQVFEPSLIAKYSANPLLFGGNNYVGLHYPMLQQLAALFRGHPFMTFTLRGSGSGGRMWTGEGVQPHVDVHTENYEQSPLMSYCLLLMQRSWRLF